jgi:lipopolysaccharide transport system ATP-binding protein
MSAIVATDVSKRFRRLATGRPRTLRSIAERTAVTEYWALRDVSFTVEQGETFGIIGANGSGKSTLLRILAGLTRQTGGEVRIDGDLGSVLTLGGGFHPMLSGEENALTGALLGGVTRDEAAARLPAITRFAELSAEDMRQPLRMLSDGQRMRLAFSVAISTDPDILLLDEVLAVGDLSFQEKCFAHLESLQDKGVTIVVVSHDLGQIRRLCDRTLWLEKGETSQIGRPQEVSLHYERAMHGESQAVPLDDGAWRIGTRRVEICDVRLAGAGGERVSRIATGDSLTIELDYKSHRALPKIIFGVGIHTEGDERTCLDIDTESDLSSPGPVEPGEGSLRLDLGRLDLGGGAYYVDVGAYSADWEETYDYHWKAAPLEMKGRDAPGDLDPPRTWIVS